MAKTVKACGRFALLSFTTTPGPVQLRISKSRCKSYSCPACRPRNLKALRCRAYSIQNTETWRFLTLTASMPGTPQAKDLRRLAEAWRRFLYRLKKEYPKLKYFRVLDCGKGGNWHFHVLVSSYIPFEWLQRAWKQSGGGWHVYIKMIPPKQAGSYAVKYVTQARSWRPEVEKAIYESGCRRFAFSKNCPTGLKEKTIKLFTLNRSFEAIQSFAVAVYNFMLPYSPGLTVCSAMPG